MAFALPKDSKFRKSYEGQQAAFVNLEFKRRQDERRPFELQWRLNLAFIEGNQYVDINAAAQTLTEIPKAVWWQEREVFNHVGPIIETRISRLARMHPILKTRPGTGDQADIRAAKIGTHLLTNTYSDKGVQNKIQEAANWAEACGSVFFKNIWNPNSGPVVAQVAVIPEMAELPEPNNNTFGMDGYAPGMQDVHLTDKAMSPPPEPQEEMVTETLREGDLDILVVPPQEIYPDSCYRQNISDCKSIIHARAYHVDEIEATWGVRVSAETVTVMQLHRTMHGMGGMGYGSGSYYHTVNSLKNHALVKEYWERPSSKYPEGRLIIVAGDKVLYSGKIPFQVGEDGQPDIPFAKYDCIERPGVFWGRAVCERLIPVQRRYNALRNRKAEYINRIAIGVVTYQEGSVDEEVLEQEGLAPGAMIPYKQGANPPQFMKNDSLPFSFEKEEATLLQEFSQLSGVSELSRQSKADPGVKSGVALQTALEQDDVRLSSTAANLEQFMTENGKQWLRLYKQYVSGPRVLRIVGKNNVVEVLDWTGADIQSDDVIVEPYSAMLENPQQRRQMVYDLLQAGLFNDPETGKISKEMRSKVFEMIQLGNWETGDDDDELHLARAERENHRMTEGGMASAVEYDDHFLHISRHNKFRLTAEYEALLAEDPLIEQRFAEHVLEHFLHLQQVAGAQAQPGGGTKPPQPGEILQPEPPAA